MKIKNSADFLIYLNLGLLLFYLFFQLPTPLKRWMKDHYQDRMEHTPAYPSLKEDFIQAIQQTLKYPEVALAYEEEGSFWVNFEIDKNGYLRFPYLVGVPYSLNSEPLFGIEIEAGYQQKPQKTGQFNSRDIKSTPALEKKQRQIARATMKNSIILAFQKLEGKRFSPASRNSQKYILPIHFKIKREF